MKTLKYLILVLVVAFALPAMAQEMERVSMGSELKPATGGKIGGKIATEQSAVTTGKLSQHFNYTVQVVKGDLIAVVEGKKVTLALIKKGNGSNEKYCTGLKSVCPSGFTYVEDTGSDEAVKR